VSLVGVEEVVLVFLDNANQFAIIVAQENFAVLIEIDQLVQIFLQSRTKILIWLTSLILGGVCLSDIGEDYGGDLNINNK